MMLRSRISDRKIEIQSIERQKDGNLPLAAVRRWIWGSGSSNVVSWHAGRRGSSRTVVKKWQVSGEEQYSKNTQNNDDSEELRSTHECGNLLRMTAGSGLT